jgi:hypothetical protein
LGQFAFEVNHVVVLEQYTLSTGVAHALDHGSVVHGVREEDAAGEFRAEGRERSVVCHVARGEDEGGGFPVERSELLLET